MHRYTRAATSKLTLSFNGKVDTEEKSEIAPFSAHPISTRLFILFVNQRVDYSKRRSLRKILLYKLPVL